MPLSTGEEYSLLVPVQMPPSLLAHPMFKRGYECYYSEVDPEEAEAWTVPKLVNEVYRTLAALYYEKEPDCPWTLGFLLGELTSLSERDRTLALTGLAHCCFLLSFISLDGTLPWLWSCFLQARFQHGEALRAYRARVRGYRVQGKSFAEAQQLALAGSAQQHLVRRKRNRE